MKNHKRICTLCFSAWVVFLFAACSAAPSGEQAAAPPTLSPSPQPSHELIPSSTAAPSETAAPPTAAPQPTITLTPTQAVFRVLEIDQMAQVYVPAGDFLIGSTDKEAKITYWGGRAYPEIPQHTLYLDGFWMDKYEVTNSQYALCVADGICQLPYLQSSSTRPEYYGNPEFANYPVIWVSWHLARTYCEWAGRRLPTEAEWEKAARGTDGAKYPWGNEPLTGQRANFCDINCPKSIANPNYDDGYADTAPVGSYPAGASPYGAMDMSGNVWEWTSTQVRDYPYVATDGREDLEAGGERVWRGGPWSNGVWWMRSSVRYRSVQTYWHYSLGFRCASSE